ncbi:SUMF1/EgtB/PvdO family nonheme iron enzyme [Trichocoleus sp. FACHB-591]|uniref:SUMF1/EgtB/PvdO family nonheme iron enzyme n=1 Tax=Trichocoleus sp. FACHB-591 TaxID=2692872 RepID=UPI0016874C33|nr:SUMF1/EgtB/PvdO family nonheme iron enzyme [Trichocoleus sp. FACHB-591]MBD2093572.1 SUMF1/EgtB/PvdO family nonheme iron enzyme [Trichocoleus sp. FACHB-591]
MGKNWAIAVGINQYRYLQPLHYAVRDAAAMCDYFSHEVRFEQVYYFSDNSPPIQQDYGPPLDSVPTFTTLRRFLRSRFEQPFLQTGDNLWFFFAGHGIRHEDRDYLMPIDGDPGEVEGTAIPLSYVTERLRRSGADNVVLLVDACRNEGRRAGVGVGEEVQQGVITLFSCSPRESSYEIEQLQQGAFTHTLLQGLRLQGEGNCATVERLDQYLREHVPELSRRYNKPRQTPYATVEPAAKYHLILLPRQATLRDAETLKMAAYKAETERSFELAEQLWVRVLAVSPADSDAIAGIRRLARTPAESSPARPDLVSSSETRTVGERSTSTPQLGHRSLGLSRRRLLQLGGLGVASTGVAVLAKWISQDPPPSPINSLKPPASPNPLKSFEFTVATMNAKNEIQRQTKQGRVLEKDLGDEVKLEMVPIKGGSFTMQSDNGEPPRPVTIKPFLIGKHEVTQAQWKAVTGSSFPSSFKGSNYPVDSVSWDDARKFCDQLSNKTGLKFRLPTEAEWEYACRAGTKTPYHFGETITPELANFNRRHGETTTPVGHFGVANAFGLYDMHGNIWEWCSDPVWIDGLEKRVLRGGSWTSPLNLCRSSHEGYATPTIRESYHGFRLVCDTLLKI